MPATCSGASKKSRANAAADGSDPAALSRFCEVLNQPSAATHRRPPPIFRALGGVLPSDTDPTLARLDDPGAVRADEAALVLPHQRVLHLHHVLLRDALRDADDQRNLRLQGLDGSRARKKRGSTRSWKCECALALFHGKQAAIRRTSDDPAQQATHKPIEVQIAKATNKQNSKDRHTSKGKRHCTDLQPSATSHTGTLPRLEGGGGEGE